MWLGGLLGGMRPGCLGWRGEWGVGAAAHTPLVRVCFAAVAAGRLRPLYSRLAPSSRLQFSGLRWSERQLYDVLSAQGRMTSLAQRQLTQSANLSCYSKRSFRA